MKCATGANDTACYCNCVWKHHFVSKLQAQNPTIIRIGVGALGSRLFSPVVVVVVGVVVGVVGGSSSAGRSGSSGSR